MSLRFDRNSPPAWNERSARVDFTCVDSQTRQPVVCAVSRAALEDSTGDALDSKGCIATFARHLARIIAVANALHTARHGLPGAVVVVDSDDLLQHYPSVDGAIAAQELDKGRAAATRTAP